MANYSISQAEVNSVHVEAQPTVLAGTPTENKRVFDKYCDLIKDKFNALVEHVEEDIDTEISPVVLQLYRDLGWVPDND